MPELPALPDRRQAARRPLALSPAQKRLAENHRRRRRASTPAGAL